MENKKINCIIDTDPGVDDLVAIALSLYDETIDIKLITTVAGNLDLERVTRNALYLLQKFKRTDIPVAKGAKKAMMRVSPDATFIHQKEGMGGFVPPAVVEGFEPVKKDAVEMMYKTICEHKGDISIIELGPHTNLANLIIKHPDIVGMVNHIYTEGCAPYGWHGQGKWKNYISFNASSDPEALSIVLGCGIPVTYVTSRMGRDLANFNEQEIYQIKEINHVGEFLFEMYKEYWEHGYEDRRIATNDTCAVLNLRYPELFKTIGVDVDVNTTDMPGKTTMKKNRKSHIRLVVKVNKKKMHKKFFEAIEKLGDLRFGN